MPPRSPASTRRFRCADALAGCGHCGLVQLISRRQTAACPLHDRRNPASNRCYAKTDAIRHSLLCIIREPESDERSAIDAGIHAGVPTCWVSVGPLACRSAQGVVEAREN